MLEELNDLQDAVCVVIVIAENRKDRHLNVRELIEKERRFLRISDSRHVSGNEKEICLIPDVGKVRAEGADGIGAKVDVCHRGDADHPKCSAPVGSWSWWVISSF